MVNLSLLPLEFSTKILCSLELKCSIFNLAISLTLRPEQNAKINQHLCFKDFSLLKILIKVSLVTIVGILFLN